VGRINIGQIAVRRDFVALAALLLVGLGLGLAAARLVIGEPRVSQVEYAILAAQVYERDHNLADATDRLQAAGIAEPSRTIAEMARRYPTTTPNQAREARSLGELSKGLGAPNDIQMIEPKASQPIWLVTLVVFVFVLLLGGALVFRVLGLRLPCRPARPREAAELSDLATNAAPAGARLLGSFRKLWVLTMAPIASLAARRSAAPTRHAAPGAGSRLRPAGSDPIAQPPIRPQPAAQPVSRSTPRWSPTTERRTARPTAARGQIRFRSSYNLGDEPYDEIHPIADPRTKALVGACGVSAAHRLALPHSADLDGAGTEYWGFTAWVQDYASEEQPLRAVGLVSHWAYLNCGEEINLWLRSGQIDELREVDTDEQIRLETPNISAVLTVEAFTHGDGMPTDAYLVDLATQFEVSLRPRTAAEVGVGVPSGLGSEGSAALI
jgi:hypothetical protein